MIKSNPECRKDCDVYDQWQELELNNAILITENFKLKAENERLRTAIEETLEENGHLADGDICTLIKLKQALKGDK